MVLQRIGEILEQSCSRDQILTRIGGDEFGILVPGLGTDQAYDLADKIRFALGMDSLLRARKVTGSFGIASYPKDGNTRDEILRTADDHLYLSKRAGGNHVSSDKSPR